VAPHHLDQCVRLEAVHRCAAAPGHRLGREERVVASSVATTAGLRRYATTTTWFGGYVQAAIVSLTGLAIAVEVFPADVQEWVGYRDRFDRLVDALGERPYVVSVDRGYATRPFYR
jgi:hypothetical protein